jgi:hypothetical protein
MACLRSVAITLCVAAWAGAQGPGLDALTRKVAGEARRESSSNPDIAKNGDAKGIEPGATLVLADVDGPGMVTHLWSTVNARDPFYPRSLVVRVYYDGAEKPSVEAPLGDFFGVGHGAMRDFTSAPVTVTALGRARSCYWQMPFRKHFKMTVTNDSAEHKVDSFYYYLDWRKLDALPDDTVYFCAQYRQEQPAKPGRYTILDTKGAGQYVGTVLSAHQVESGWYGEGDDFFFIDGAEQPQLRGTGTEDYFGDAWGFREFSQPYNGVTMYEGVLVGDRVTAYRWHIPDPVPFKESLRVEMEHHGSIYDESGAITTAWLAGFVERPDWVSSVAFWYQDPPAQLEGIAPLAERLPPYRVLDPAKLTYRADPPFLVIPQEKGIMYAPNTPKAGIEFDLDIAEAGRYRIDAVIYHVLLGGIYQPLLDGKPLGGPIDTCIANADPKWLLLDTVDLTAGKHVLRFEGRDERSSAARALVKQAHTLGVERIVLLRLEDMAGYKVVQRELQSAPPGSAKP